MSDDVRDILVPPTAEPAIDLMAVLVKFLRNLPADYDPYGKDAFSFPGPTQGIHEMLTPAPGEATEAPVTVIRRTTEP